MYPYQQRCRKKELQDTLNEAQERLTFLSAGLTSIQAKLLRFWWQNFRTFHWCKTLPFWRGKKGYVNQRCDELAVDIIFLVLILKKISTKKKSVSCSVVANKTESHAVNAGCHSKLHQGADGDEGFTEILAAISIFSAAWRDWNLRIGSNLLSFPYIFGICWKSY